MPCSLFHDDENPAVLEPSHVPFPLPRTLLTPIFPEPFPSPLSGLSLNVTFWTVSHTPSYLEHPVQGRALGKTLSKYLLDELNKRKQAGTRGPPDCIASL